MTILNLHDSKKSFYIFSKGFSEKLLFWKFQENPRKVSLIEVLSAFWTLQSTLHYYAEICPPQMFLVIFQIIFKIVGREFVLESLL